MTHKKILIISAFNLSGESATDITLRSIFNHWPREKILVITTSTINEEFAQTVCLKRTYFEKIRKIFHKVLVGERSISRNVVPSVIITEKSSSKKYLEILFSIGAAYFDLINLKINKATKYKLYEFNPEIIYTTLGNIRITRLSLKLSKKFGIPLFPHFMDDWISTIYTGSMFLAFPRLFIKYHFNQLIKRIDLGFCISSKMCNEYNHRYNVLFYPLMNIIPKNKIVSLSEINKKYKQTIYISYFGGLHLNRWKSIKLLSGVIEKISENLGLKIIIQIYTSDADTIRYKELCQSPLVFFKNNIEHSAVYDYMKEADYLLHVESFDEFITKYTNYSISTKIPEYLSTGIPIIAFGPPRIASIEYLMENKVAYVITEQKTDTIEKIILEAINGTMKFEYLQNAKSLVSRNHSIESLENFKKRIQ